MAVYFALLKPGDTVLGMNLAHGGHLTHGHPLNFSGKLYTIVPYGVRKDDERIDYEELERLAHEHKPKMIMVGASAYPRVIDFPAHQSRWPQAVGAADGRRHGAHRRAGRRRRASEPGAARRLRHLDDAQDAAWTALGSDPVPRAVREGSRSRALPGRAGRPADARRSRPRRSASRKRWSRAFADYQRQIVANAKRLACQSRSRRASASSAAAPTTT